MFYCRNVNSLVMLNMHAERILKSLVYTGHLTILMYIRTACYCGKFGNLDDLSNTTFCKTVIELKMSKFD